MDDEKLLRRKIIRYWERRRIFYNLALVPPAFVGWALADTLNYVGDPHVTDYIAIMEFYRQFQAPPSHPRLIHHGRSGGLRPFLARKKDLPYFY
ncbi:MAG: hypothetical protein C5B50_07280 [Verrucomicrobia bacterium]|nr:MAG: hypothetical protein C5B50_07280 [Verrucomicrobiota bacterium]